MREPKPEIIHLINAIILEMLMSNAPRTSSDLREAFKEYTNMKPQELKNRISMAINEAGGVFENVTGRSWVLAKLDPNQ